MIFIFLPNLDKSDKHTHNITINTRYRILHKSVNNLYSINDQIKTKFGLDNLNVIAVSKTFMEEIEPLLKHGHIHFGENKVQEAVEKWTNVKNKFEDVKLHMIGKLQTNKTKYVIPLFDFLHSLDNIKLAEKISKEEEKFKKKNKNFYSSKYR